MSEIPDLFPENIVSDDSPVPPIAILKSQATHLNRRTRGLVTAEVRLSDEDPVGGIGRKLQLAFGPRQAFISFYYVVPRLKDYRVKAFEVKHKLYPPYPCTIIAERRVIPSEDPLSASRIEEDKIECNSQEEFIANLRTVLGSQKSIHMLSSLMKQVQE